MCKAGKYSLLLCSSVTLSLTLIFSHCPVDKLHAHEQVIPVSCRVLKMNIPGEFGKVMCSYPRTQPLC